MSSNIEHFQEIARQKLAASGEELCKNYTFGWGGPLAWALEMFPYIKSGVAAIHDNVSDLPICVFQSRDLLPKNMIAVVPFLSPDGNPTNTRVLPSFEIPASTLKLVTEFAQAFLFLVSTGGLPSPMDREKFTNMLISLTNRRLIMA